jgi:quinol monooxygenase YgiN
MIVAVAHVQAATDSPGEVASALDALVLASSSEPGCLAFEAARSVTDPLAFVVVHRWEDKAALDAHFEGEAFHAFEAATQGHLDSRDAEIYDVAAAERPEA